jgi:hypothetical protein
LRRDVTPVRRDPRIEGGNRFFDQDHAVESRGQRRLNGQLARFLVERGRHGEDNRLLFEALRVARPGACRVVVPRIAEMAEQTRRCLHGRQPRTFLETPGEQRRHAIDRRVGEP